MYFCNFLDVFIPQFFQKNVFQLLRISYVNNKKRCQKTYVLFLKVLQQIQMQV